MFARRVWPSPSSSWSYRAASGMCSRLHLVAAAAAKTPPPPNGASDSKELRAAPSGEPWPVAAGACVAVAGKPQQASHEISGQSARVWVAGAECSGAAWLVAAAAARSGRLATQLARSSNRKRANKSLVCSAGGQLRTSCAARQEQCDGARRPAEARLGAPPAAAAGRVEVEAEEK